MIIPYSMLYFSLFMQLAVAYTQTSNIFPESGDRFETKSEFMLCLNAVKMSLISIA